MKGKVIVGISLIVVGLCLIGMGLVILGYLNSIGYL